MVLTIGDALRKGTECLTDSDSPKLDTELLLCTALQTSRTTLFAWPERELAADIESQFLSYLERRRQGHPIAHIIGEREFWSLPLNVTRDTLIPRPDTELLVEIALDILNERPSPKIADLGTGSGAIALAIASERSDSSVIATDKSPAALTVAMGNADKLGLNNVTFRSGIWCDALPDDESFDLIISNPPYIRNDDPHLKQGDVRFEPESALTSGESGLDDLENIAENAIKHLADDGWIVLEHGYDQANDAACLLRKSGYSRVESRRDLGQNLRATIGQKAVNKEND